MLEIINELKMNQKDKIMQGINIKIGMHTGPVIAGIIGSRMVKYDIFGEGVLIANKLKRNAIQNSVCISEDTKKLLTGNPEIALEYYYTEAGTFYVKPYNRDVKIYNIEKKKTESMRDAFSSRDAEMSDHNSDCYTMKDDQEESGTSRSLASNQSLVAPKSPNMSKSIQ
jgi:class 3 adenylate cyclase